MKPLRSALWETYSEEYIAPKDFGFVLFFTMGQRPTLVTAQKKSTSASTR